ncbi:GreA/GreB family elongation factor [Echinicola soli]|uniref:GreA/GreB family elongation factor n=1 Tax=Echinicola soli TaxID=2591634 RepID=A0A514CMV3_9BACT|nr:GreA/GreB family elongation factor [Echinicola soli]QDH81128.1 GreA/GreB family elongation factor [Echinicola soli]
MKPLIRKSDYDSIKKILIATVQMGYHRDTLALEKELRNCTVVADHLVGDHIVRPGSTVEVLDSLHDRTICVTIVTPKDACVSTGHISILAPLAVALLGFEEGHEFTWNLPSGERRLKIEKVK